MAARNCWVRTKNLIFFLIHVTVVTNARKEIKNIVLGILAFKIYRAKLGFAEDDLQKTSFPRTGSEDTLLRKSSGVASTHHAGAVERLQRKSRSCPSSFVCPVYERTVN